MQVIALRTLRQFWRKHPQAEGPLRFWYELVTKAEWKGPADVKDLFGTAVDFVADNRIVFDIAGNKYRLVVRVSYRFKSLQIKFVGTHREYDEIDAETVR
jgi:mRNA interferase HigB